MYVMWSSLTLFHRFPVPQPNTPVLQGAGNAFPNSLFYALVLLTACANHLYLTSPNAPIHVLKRRAPRPFASFTVGELIVLIAFILFQVGWFIFFFYLTGTYSSGLRNVARAVGHFNDLCISLLVLPVARNSIWSTVYGIPYERAIRYHRYLGRATFFYVTLHMLCWWISWLVEQGGEAWASCVFMYNCTQVTLSFFRTNMTEFS